MDQTINCCDCKKNFNFSEGEQTYYKQRGFETPKRCPACRKLKKQRFDNQFKRPFHQRNLPPGSADFGNE